MRSSQFLLRTFALGLLFTAALAQAAPVTGTVTNKTTGKPAVGDPVVLVDVQAGMGEVAKTTTDARGHYALNTPGTSNYLVRVTHQGSTYFIGAPQGGAPGDLTVYDVASKVQGVTVEADVMEMETDNSRLQVTERFFVHNTSSPPLTQWSQRSFEIVVPADASIEGAQAQRPSGLPTSISLDAAGPKGHYAYNFPIQPDEGDKNTLFQLTYSVPFNGKLKFKVEESLPAANVAVLLPKSMTFTGGAGASFKNVPEDPGVQTFLTRGAVPGKAIEFTIEGTGSMPREQQGAAAGQHGGMGADNSGQAGAPGNQPGGGLGTPINTPDPLSKYKWWILAGLALLLAAGAAFLLGKPVGGAPGGVAAEPVAGTEGAAATPAIKQSALLNALKEELFALESEKINGTLSAKEYAEVKAALETVLKRALKHNS